MSEADTGTPRSVPSVRSAASAAESHFSSSSHRYVGRHAPALKYDNKAGKVLPRSIQAHRRGQQTLIEATLLISTHRTLLIGVGAAGHARVELVHLCSMVKLADGDVCSHGSRGLRNARAQPGRDEQVHPSPECCSACALVETGSASATECAAAAKFSPRHLTEIRLCTQQRLRPVVLLGDVRAGRVRSAAALSSQAPAHAWRGVCLWRLVGRLHRSSFLPAARRDAGVARDRDTLAAQVALAAWVPRTRRNARDSHVRRGDVRSRPRAVRRDRAERPAGRLLRGPRL